MEALFISEIFASIQGEGALCGVPSVFVRTSGCNLRCDWCDTPYASWTPEGTHSSVEEVIEEVTGHTKIRHAVLTGGEPMLAKGLKPLSAELKRRGWHITIETAGTIYQELPVDLLSISPKLSNSQPRRGPESWKRRHEEARMRPDIIARLMEMADHQLKFVVSNKRDLEEVDELIELLGPAPAKVLLMPEGRSAERLDESADWVVKACMERGWRFCDRLHVRLFGDTRGT